MQSVRYWAPSFWISLSDIGPVAIPLVAEDPAPPFPIADPDWASAPLASVSDNKLRTNHALRIWRCLQNVSLGPRRQQADRCSYSIMTAVDSDRRCSSLSPRADSAAAGDDVERRQR